MIKIAESWKSLRTDKRDFTIEDIQNGKIHETDNLYNLCEKAAKEIEEKKFRAVAIFVGPNEQLSIETKITSHEKG